MFTNQLLRGGGALICSVFQLHSVNNLTKSNVKPQTQDHRSWCWEDVLTSESLVRVGPAQHCSWPIFPMGQGLFDPPLSSQSNEIRAMAITEPSTYSRWICVQLDARHSRDRYQQELSVVSKGIKWRNGQLNVRISIEKKKGANLKEKEKNKRKGLQ